MHHESEGPADHSKDSSNGRENSIRSKLSGRWVGQLDIRMGRYAADIARELVVPNLGGDTNSPFEGTRLEETIAEGSGFASSSAEIVSDPSITPEVREVFAQINQDIAEAHGRLEQEHAEHIKNSQQEIIKTAERAIDRVPRGQSKKALLIGIGRSFDIPLRTFRNSQKALQ